MTTYALRGAELAQRGSRMGKPEFRAFLATLTERDKDALELEYRRQYFAKIKREAAAAFAGPKRPVRDDVPTLESIDRQFGVTHPWDITPDERREQAETDRLLALPTPSQAAGADALEASRSWLPPDAVESEGDRLARTDPITFIEGIEREAALAELAERANAPEPKPTAELEEAFLRAELDRLNRQ